MPVHRKLLIVWIPSRWQMDSIAHIGINLTRIMPLTNGLEARLRGISPRYTRPATPWPSVLIHGSVAAVWVLLFAHAFHGRGIGAWSVGILYIAYDTFLLAFTFVQTLPLRRAATPAGDIRQRPALTVIVAAYNEEAVLDDYGAGVTERAARADRDRR